MGRNQARLGWAAQREPDVLLIELLSLKDHEGLKVGQTRFHGAVLLGILGQEAPLWVGGGTSFEGSGPSYCQSSWERLMMGEKKETSEVGLVVAGSLGHRQGLGCPDEVVKWVPDTRVKLSVTLTLGCCTLLSRLYIPIPQTRVILSKAAARVSSTTTDP